MEILRQYNILIVDDEFINAKFIAQSIRKLGHLIVGNVKNANDALKIAKRNEIDFVFMDINLNDKIDGILCADLLNQKQKIAVIYMSAFSDSQTIKNASKTNIYGYLIKPFSINEIEATLSVAIQRVFGSKDNENKIQSNIKSLGDNYIYNFSTKTFLIDNVPIHLTNKETEVLNLLCLNINQNISYELLENSVWDEKEITSSTIRDTVLRLRKKAPLLNLDNIVGIGYCLKKDYV